MPPPVSGIHKAFPTAATPVSVVVCMFTDNVFLHGGLVLEPVRAEGAAVWPLSRMGPDVVGEKLPLREPGLAHMAMVILHTIVGLHMLGVSCNITKRGAALFTSADHLPCVDAFVSRQVTTP